MLQFSHFLVGGTSLVMALAKRQTDRFACLEQFSILNSEGILKKTQHVSGPCSFGGEAVHVDADNISTE